MRILYLHQHFTLRSGSAPARSHAAARVLAARGHEVSVLCGRYQLSVTGLEAPFVRGRREGRVDGFRVVELDLPYRNALGPLSRLAVFLRYAAASIREASLGPYDLVFASSTPLSVALGGIAARSLRGRPFVLELRDLWPDLLIAMGALRNPGLILAMRLLERAAYRSATGVVAVTQGIARSIAARGVDPARITVVPNGADLAPLPPPAPSPWIEEGREHPVLLYAGTVGRANGLEAALDLAAELQRRGSRWRVVVVGEGSRRPALVAEAAARGLSCIGFLPALPQPALQRLLAGSRAGFQCLADVEAFREGTSPNKLFEYLGSGLPVLVNTPGWVARLVEEAQAGAASFTASAAADALDRLLDPAVAADTARHARALAERFDRTALANLVAVAIETAAERHLAVHARTAAA